MNKILWEAPIVHHLSNIATNHVVVSMNMKLVLLVATMLCYAMAYYTHSLNDLVTEEESTLRCYVSPNEYRRVALQCMQNGNAPVFFFQGNGEASPSWRSFVPTNPFFFQSLRTLNFVCVSGNCNHANPLWHGGAMTNYNSNTRQCAFDTCAKLWNSLANWTISDSIPTHWALVFLLQQMIVLADKESVKVYGVTTKLNIPRFDPCFLVSEC